MGDRRKLEYDAFGPWIIEIYQKNILPELFSNFVNMDKKYDLLIKIPRNIERRRASPKMELYDYVIGVCKDELYIYERNGKIITEKIFKLCDIYSIKIYTSLLFGQVFIQIKNSIFTFNFNTISEDIIMKLAILIRRKFIKEQDFKFENYVESENIGKTELYYHTMWDRINRREKNIKIMAIQQTKKLKYNDRNIIRKILYRLTRSKLLSCLYLTNDKELIIIKKGENFSINKRADYSETFTYIPFHRISKISIKDSKYTKEVKEIILQVGGEHIKLLFDENNEYKNIFYNNLKSFVNTMDH